VGVKVFDQESRQEVEVFCDNDPLMPADLLPFEELTGKTDRCDEYLLRNGTIDREHPDHVCGVTAFESVRRFRADLYGDLMIRFPPAVSTAWPMPIGAESIQAFASRRGVDPLSMLPGLTEQGDAWLGMVVRRRVLQANPQVVGWVRLYGLVERIEPDQDRETTGDATVWQYGPPRVTVECSQPFKSRKDPVARTVRALLDWHKRNVLHQPLSGGGRPRGTGTWRDAEHFKSDLLPAIRTAYGQGDVGEENVAKILIGTSGRQLRAWLEDFGLNWEECKAAALAN
jgi:hypothetical protein